MNSDHTHSGIAIFQLSNHSPYKWR